MPRFLAALLALVISAAQAATLEGRVVRVADGDTLTVLDSQKRQYTIRINGVDAPEKGQPFGDRSRQNLAHYVAGKDVRVDWHKKDQYGRLVGQIWVAPPDCPTCPKTLDVGLAQVRDGLAWHYKRFELEQTPKDRVRYGKAEHEARSKRVGLWQDKEPVAPWEWRRRGRER